MKNTNNIILLILWYIFIAGLLFANQIPSLNQFFLKFFIPVLFIYMISKTTFLKIFSNFDVLKYYIYLFFFALLSLIYTVDINGTFTYLQSILGNILIITITISMVIHLNSPLKAVSPLILGFVTHLLFGFLTPVELQSSRDIARITGLESNANALSFYYYYGIVLLMFTIIYYRLAKKNRIIIFTLLAIFIIGILYTGSRKSFFSIVIFFTVFYSLQISLKRTIFLLILLGVAYFSLDYIVEVISNYTAVGQRLDTIALERSAEIRGNLINDGLEMFLENPIFGVGLGSFKVLSHNGLMSHNDYIEILATMGPIALVIYMLIYFRFYKLISQFGRLDSISSKRKRAFYLSFLLSFLFLGMGRPSFLAPLDMLIVALLFSISYIDLKIIKPSMNLLPSNQS